MAFRDVMHTSNPVYKYPFSWTIDNFDNFSVTSSELQGPTFTPIPGLPRKYRFELAFRKIYEPLCNPDFDISCYDCESDNCDCKVPVNILDMKLIDLNDSNNPVSLYVVANIKLRNEDGILFKDESGATKVEETTTLASYRDFELPLQYHQLTMKGTLQFSGYRVKSNIHPLSVPRPLENRRELSKNFKTMYESGFGSDVTFFVGEEKFPAHKAILSCRSPVFAKMFEHDMLENNTNEVTIREVDAHAFNCFLIFLYTGVVEDDGLESVLSLYSLAYKYQVKTLHSTCCVLLVNHLDVELVCKVLYLADLHGDVELKGAVQVFIRDNFFDVAATTMWGELLTTKPELAHDVVDCIKSIDNDN